MLTILSLGSLDLLFCLFNFSAAALAALCLLNSRLTESLEALDTDNDRDRDLDLDRDLEEPEEYDLFRLLLDEPGKKNCNKIMPESIKIYKKGGQFCNDCWFIYLYDHL